MKTIEYNKLSEIIIPLLELEANTEINFTEPVKIISDRSNPTNYDSVNFHNITLKGNIIY